MITVNIHEAKTNLSKLITRLEKTGESIRICRNGRPVAELKPTEPKGDPLKTYPEISNIKIMYERC